MIKVKHGRQSFGSLKPYNDVKENTGWKKVEVSINYNHRKMLKLKKGKK